MKFLNNKLALLIMVLMVLITVKAAMADSSNLGASITLVNMPPILTTNPLLNSTSPHLNDTLLCINGTYYDLNNNTEGGRETAWRKNGGLLGGQTAYTLNLNSIVRAHFDNITCEQRVNDIYNWSSWYSSPAATIKNNIPIAYNLNISPSNPTKSTPITCTWNYSDEDADPQMNTRIEWYVSGVLVLTDYANISSDTLATTYFVKHNNISCKVYASDGHNISSATTSAYLDISNSPPTFTSATLLPDPSYKSSTFNCIINGRQDIDGDAMTNYFIFRNGSNILQSSTSSTLDCLTNSNCVKGTIITCDGYVYDGESNSSIHSDTSSVLNTIPEAQSVIITPYTPFNTSDLTCNYNYYDLDNDTQSAVYYKWYQNNSLTGFTSQIISYHNTSANQTWKCGIIVNDGQANGTETISTTVTIGGANPMIIIIQPIGTVDEGSSITITWNWTSLLYPATGPYTHYLCGSNNFTSTGCGGTTICSFQTDAQGQCNYTVDGTLPSSNDFYLKIVDGLNRSSQVEPLAWTLNHKPTATSLNYSVQASTNYNTYTCALNNVSDIDGDTLYRLYQFQDSPTSILQSYSTTNTFIISTGTAVHGGNITCKAKVFDSRIYSSELSKSDNIRIYNPSYSSPLVVDQYMTIFAQASSEITSVNLSIKSPVNVLYSGLTMTLNNATNKWEFTFAPFAVGNWYVQEMQGASANQSYLFIGQNDIFVVTSGGVTPEGGGGGGGEKIIEKVVVQNVTTVGCGNKICEEGENPLTCQADCSINYDSLITCLIKPDIPCNWKQSWFPVFLIIGVTLTLGFVAIRSASLGAKVKRK